MRANLALLTCEAMGHRYADAVWAAVAVELVHNFSLVFDDVQDGDPLRRGRPSLWKVWGADQAINAGAALEALVTSAVVELLPARHQDRLRPALALLTTAMIGLCRGQVLDLQFEQRVDVTLEEYLAMVALVWRRERRPPIEQILVPVADLPMRGRGGRDARQSKRRREHMFAKARVGIFGIEGIDQ